MIITQSISSKETDLLTGNEFCHIIVHELGHYEGAPEGVCFGAPPEGWTHESLDLLETQHIRNLFPDGYDVYLGISWIGSSEI